MIVYVNTLILNILSDIIAKITIYRGKNER